MKGLNTNFPDLMPNHEQWLRKDTWELNDAVCLLRNIDPTKQEHLLKRSQQFKNQYLDDLDTAEKAEYKSLEVAGGIGTHSSGWGVVYARVEPKIFMQWAYSKGYSIPDQFKSLLATDESKLASDSLSALRNSDYWRYLEKVSCKAIEKYPEWRNNFGKEPRKEDIVDWLNLTIKINTTREAEIVKNVLTEVFKIN